MSGSLSWSIDIEWESQVYDLHIDYSIDGYTDPETGEYFGGTSWFFTFARVPAGGSDGGADSGSGSESNAITEGLLADSVPSLFHYQLDFKAWNTFSGDLDPLEARWDVFNATFATGPQIIVGTSTSDIVIGGSGDDLIRGFAGADTIDGGDGERCVAR